MHSFQSVVIESPRDVTYPFARETFENPKIFYHGTSSIFSERLATNGFRLGDLPFEISDVIDVCESYESIGFFGFDAGGYGVLRAYTLGTLSSTDYMRMPVSFACGYWSARRYARNPGGETVSHILKAGRQFRELVESPSKMEAHRESLSDRLRHPAFAAVSSFEPTESKERLAKSEDSRHLSNELEKIMHISNKYYEMTKSTYPVLYAVELSPEWIESKGQYSWESEYKIARYMDSPSEVRSVATIPASSIVGLVEFVNGADRWQSSDPNKTLPLPWLLTDEENDIGWDEGFFL